MDVVEQTETRTERGHIVAVIIDNRQNKTRMNGEIEDEVLFASDNASSGVTKFKMELSSQNADVRRLVGVGEDMGQMIGLDKDWSYRIIKQVGNYGESWTEFFGPESPLNLPRGLNRLWTDGGLMYAMPIR